MKRAGRWANRWTAERSDPWRHKAFRRTKAERPDGPPASTRTQAPVPVAIAGYDPDRIESWQASGGGWAE